MSTSFSRTMRALGADSFRAPLLALLLVGLLAGAWLAWFFYASVARYEVTASARLEVAREAHVVQSPLLGRVVASHLALGRAVEAGDVLVELDANPERLELEEAQSRLAALAAHIGSLKAQIAAGEDARARERQASAAAVEEAGARLRESEAMARLAENESARLEKLRAAGLVPHRDFEQGKLEAERRRAASDSLRPVAGRLAGEQRTRESDREAGLKALWAEVRRLEGEAGTTRAAAARLRYEIERRQIRAPVAGRLDEVAPLRPGAVVDEGDRLGAIVPAGALRVVAQFAPAAALGRIRAGQRARLRLEGFPWAQYGSVEATVTSVAGEVRNGTVRVELAAAPAAARSLPLQHGLPGSVEVEVERVSPATLALRAAGRLLAGPRMP